MPHAAGALGNGKRRRKKKEGFWLRYVYREEFLSLEECFLNTSIYNNHLGSLLSMQIPRAIASNLDAEVFGLGISIFK